MKYKEDIIKWKKFKRNNIELIEKAGLPLEYYTKEELWLDFLDHGYIDHHNVQHQFNIGMLSVSEHEHFLQLIIAYFQFGFEYFTPSALIFEKDKKKLDDMFQQKK